MNVARTVPSEQCVHALSRLEQAVQQLERAVASSVSPVEKPDTGTLQAYCQTLEADVARLRHVMERAEQDLAHTIHAMQHDTDASCPQ